MSRFETFLRRRFRHKEIGWYEYEEKFTRYALVKTRWGALYLHQLNAPKWQPLCHDHPWGFVAILIWPGYLEKVGDRIHRRRPGSILYRPATFTHAVLTPFGTSWSLVLAGPKSREWGFKECVHDDSASVLPA